MPSRVEPLSEVSYEQAESPRWDSRGDRLIWVDMARGEFYVGRLIDGAIVTELVVPVGPSIGFAAPLLADGEGWVAVSERDVLHISAQGDIRPVVTEVGVPFTQFNDGACDPDGLLWAGTQSHGRVPDAALFSIDHDGMVRQRLAEVVVSNGLGFSPDGRRMYYIDTLPHRRLEVFDLVDGELQGRKTVATIGGGNPDGLVVDAEGGVWVAVWDAAEVRRYSAAGALTHVFELPALRPSAVTIIDSLVVVTTARRGLPNPTADDGRLFGFDAGIPGVAANAWRPSARMRARLGLRVGSGV